MPKKEAASGSKTKKAPAQQSSTSIDDIFAAPKAKKTSTVSEPNTKKDKGKSKASSEANVASSSKVEDGEKKKKKKKVKKAAEFKPEEEVAESKVETVVDPSTIPVAVPEPAVKPKKDKGKKRSAQEDEEDEMFKDSRGTGPRRKTEEGFLIYKEKELEIDPEAGGTPLCPFDCDCCF
ncbi:hypothetical protein L202_04449 [Cryptococcus amylolentus CBS 6039]|uniref:DUF1764 domain-containing protein n=1 Tax=Cryptococcus amylolentus CBS 6039 TaxID=1295533 RepID=A0A1E3HTB2_9TREE|nr:hypothetical protein L202_04449 [Cryptococcus amylolentus CBS 6039]ODN78926.1 hypothetical protein L202_04449 [Cryptococcus amylolentus CBS 6039]